MTTPDHDRFRPDGTPERDPAAESYGSAPAPSSGRLNPFPESSLTPPVPSTPTPVSPSPRPWQPMALPYGATGDAPTGPVRGPDGVPPGNPYLGTVPPAPRGRRRRRAASGVVLATLGAVMLAGLLVRVVSGEADDAYPPSGGGTPTPVIGTSWVVTASDLDPDGGTTELVLGVDGAFTGPSYVDAGEILVVASGPSHNDPAALSGLDSETGAVLWHRSLPGVLCGDQAFDEALLCLTDDAGVWTFHRIDLRSGEDLATAVTDLKDVQTVHAGPDALVVVGPANPAPHAVMTGFDPDGTLLWSLDVADVDGAEYLFDDLLASDLGNAGSTDATMERPRWRDLDDGLMMLWVTPGVALIDPVTGEIVAHECLRATPSHDRYYCQDDAGINRRDLAGEVVWSLPDLQLTYVAYTSDARPVAVSERFELIPVDWETGEVTGGAVYRFDPQPGGFTGTIMGPSAIGDAQAQYLEQDGTTVVRLADDRDDIAWEYVAEDGYVDSAVEIDGVTVLLEFALIGLDADTGEVLWERRNTHGFYAHRHDDSIIGIGFDEIARLELP